MAKNEEWKAGEWKRLEREECKRSILAGASFFFSSSPSTQRPAVPRAEIIVGKPLRLQQLPIPNPDTMLACSHFAAAKKKGKSTHTAPLVDWRKKKKRNVSFVTLIKGWSPWQALRLCRGCCVGWRDALLLSSSLFHSVFRGQRSGGGACCTCFLQSGHFASVVLPLIPFEPPVLFLLFSCVCVCALCVWERSLPFLFKSLLVDPTHVLVPRRNTRESGEEINLELLLQQLKGPHICRHIFVFHPELQQQQPDLSCACEELALDLLGAICLTRCLHPLAKKWNKSNA